MPWLSVGDWFLTSHVILKVSLPARPPKQIPPTSMFGFTLLIYLCFIWKTLVPFQSSIHVYIDAFCKYGICHTQPVFAINNCMY